MRDGDKCINCKAVVKEGKIKHLRGCPDNTTKGTK